MRTVIIACKTLEDELNYAIKNTGIDYPIEWIESGLHNIPKNLNNYLQNILNDIKADRALVTMGFCGNSLIGIQTGAFELIVPRVDDCISLLIGSPKKRAQITNEHAAYFLTEGWMRGERNIWNEYTYSVDKYGEEIAKSIFDMMYAHYRTLGLLDSGVSSMQPLLESTKKIADTLKLEQKIIPASVSYIEQLITGPWTEDKFVVKASNSTVTANDLNLL